VATQITQLTVGLADRSAFALNAELWRTLNAVGRWEAPIRNNNGVFNGVFDIQDLFAVNINGNPLMRGVVDGPGVVLRGQDATDIWEEFVLLSGVDQAQDLLFHNDFEKFYPDTSQQITEVLDDIFNVELVGSTNILYTAPLVPPPAPVGAIEFREGTNFLSELQEMFRTAGWVFYVDDGRVLRAGAPGFISSGVTLTSVAGGASNNIIGIVDLKERDGDKLYNFIKLYGKNPLFDAYTELNASSWTTVVGGNAPVDDVVSVRVGTYSQRVFNNNPVSVVLRHRLTLPIFNHTTWDFSKGEIGVWGRYDNQAAGGGGEPGAGASPFSMQVECRLFDSVGRIANYYGASSTIYRGDWGFCTFPLGEGHDSTTLFAADQWTTPFGPGAFDWNNVTGIWFQLPRSNLGGNLPSNFYIDGITLPVPPIAVSQNAASQTSYRRRPYVDAFPEIRTQNALQERSDEILTHHETTGIDFIKLMSTGNTSLRYAGQSVTINIPSLGLNAAIFNIVQLHHIVEPHMDVSGGFGHDFVTEVEAVPISGIAFDMSRLREGSMYSTDQRTSRDGMGLRVK